MHSRWYLHLMLLVCIVALAGCREAATQARQRQSSHLRSLLTLFNLAESKLGHRPANEAEFKSFIKDKGQATLDALHLASVDDLFISDHDGQPFIVLYGEQPKGPTHEVVACEQKGVEGKRLAGYSLGAIFEIDDEGFAAIAAAAKTSGK